MASKFRVRALPRVDRWTLCVVEHFLSYLTFLWILYIGKRPLSAQTDDSKDRRLTWEEKKLKRFVSVVVKSPPCLSLNEPHKKCKAAVDVVVAISPVLQAAGTLVEPICERLHFIHLAPLSAPTLNVTAVPQESIDYIDPWGGTAYIFMRQRTAVLKSYIKEGHRWRWLVGDRDTLGFLHHHLHLSGQTYAGLKWVYQPDLVVWGMIVSKCSAARDTTTSPTSPVTLPLLSLAPLQQISFT